MRLTFKDFSTFIDAEQLDEDAVWDGIKRKLRLQPDEEKEVLDKLEAEKAKAKGPKTVAKAAQVKRIKTTAERQREKRIQDATDQYKAAQGINEAKEFTVTYKRRDGGDKEYKWNVKGRDVTHVKRQFADNFAGGKIVMVTPAKPKPLTPAGTAPSPSDSDSLGMDDSPLTTHKPTKPSKKIK